MTYKLSLSQGLRASSVMEGREHRKSVQVSGKMQLVLWQGVQGTGCCSSSDTMLGFLFLVDSDTSCCKVETVDGAAFQDEAFPSFRYTTHSLPLL
jgi:hypothetical protein